MVERRLVRLDKPGRTSGPSGDEPLPPPPERGAAKVTAALGGITFLLGLVGVALSGARPSPSWILLLSGLTNAYFSWRAFRDGDAMQRLRAAADRHATGRLEEARALVAAAERRSSSALVRRFARLSRASMALAEDDYPRAIDEATEALERMARPRLAFVRGFARAPTWAVDASLLGVRALARALSGDTGGARADAAALDAHLANQPKGVGLQASPTGGMRAIEQAVAEARLAEAVALARAADRAGLSAHLAQHRTIILRELGPKERSLVRGFDRLLALPSPSPYRARDASAEADAWAEVLGAHAGASRAVTEADAVPGEPGARMGKAAGRDWSSWKRLALGMGFGVFMSVFVGVMTGLQAKTHAFGTPALTAILLAPMVAFLAYIAAATRKQTTRRDALVAARLRIAAEPSLAAARSVEDQAKSAEPLTRAQGNLILAHEANADSAFAIALEHAERGLVPVQGRMIHGIGGATLVPALVTERALAKAALGRAKEAIDDVTKIPDGVAFRTRSIESVRLVAAVATDDRKTATRIALALAKGAVALDLRVDTLVRVVRALALSGNVGRVEVSSLATELSGGPARAWLHAVAPALLRDFDGLVADESTSDRAGSTDARAEAEAEAEAEAAAAEGADGASARAVQPARRRP